MPWLSGERTGCGLNPALGAVGIALSVVGGRKMQHGRALRYSLNRVTVHF